jgi:iron complex transport system ATP-binding protein
MSPVVAAEGVTFRIGAKLLVDAVSLAISPGGVTVVIGPNGAGKSTLARLIAGELKPSAGSVAYDGRAAPRWPAWRLACKRSMLPQKSSLSFPFTAADVVRIGAETVGRRLNAREQDARVLDALSRADVVHLAARDYQTLSGGEQQRVQFARVLCQIDVGRSVEERQLLILDEPTASLDIKHQLIILDEAVALARRGCAILAVLHDVNLAAAYADTVLVMKDARAAVLGAPAKVLTEELLTSVFEVPMERHGLPDRASLYYVRRGATPAR